MSNNHGADYWCGKYHELESELTALREKCAELQRQLDEAAEHGEAAKQEPSRPNYERMFNAAVMALAEVSEYVGSDPDDGGAAPIIETLEEWKQFIAQSAETIARLKAESKRIDEENRTLRNILSECASALDNGSVASPDCSMRFLSDIPKEIAAETKVRKQKLAAAQADNARLREALNDIASPNSNHEIFTNAPAGMTLDRMYEEIAQAALAQRLDTSALETYVAQKTAWQPIETAPKDSRITLWGRYWSDEQGWFQFPMQGMWNPHNQRWECQGALWFGVRPTLWLPLPPAPDKQNK